MTIHEQKDLVPKVLVVSYKGQDVTISIKEYNIMARRKFITSVPGGKPKVNEELFISLMGEDPYKELK